MDYNIKNKKIQNICTFGDSLVYGMGATTEGGWVTLLSEKLDSDNFKIWNYGIPGDHTQDLIERIPDECKEHKPDTAIVLIGANDSQYQGLEENFLIKPDRFKTNLEKIAIALKKHTADITFIGLPNMDDDITTTWKYKYHFCNDNLKKYDNIIKEFCQENGFNYINIFGILEKEDLSDGAHPNDKGYQKIADKVFKELKI